MPTDNHGYNTPSEGASDWHIPLNENFEGLDADVMIRDQESALGNYTPNQGQPFLATDTGRLFVGDGSQFVGIGYLTPTRVFVQSSEPSSPQAGDIWVDTS